MFKTESPVLDQIYEDLTRRYWKRDWRPQQSARKTENKQILTPADWNNAITPMTDTLRFETFNGRQEAISQNFQTTYRWIFDRRPKRTAQGPQWHSFPEWLESTSDPVYWITGKPGSGKSTIMKYIAESEVTKRHLRRWSRRLPVLVVSYYAWIAGHSLQKSWDGLKRTVLYQALQALSTRPDLISLVSPRRWTLAEALPYSRRFPIWETWEMEESFDRLLKICGQAINVVIFIDGLDEFNLSPTEVVKLIKEITSISSSVKICVASRPWTEFDDAFGKVPLLQMHLLTLEDTKLFVAGQLDENQGFQEIRNIYPKQADEIKEEIVTKSRGVFLWVSVVVQSLLISLSEGESIHDLQATLESLPSDLSSLYDVIWARIRDRNRRDGSWMIQVVAAAQGPLSCFSMWLADESRTTRVNVKRLPVNVKVHASLSLKRRLASRTRGLLEMTGDIEKVVDFSHRTARDWSQQSERPFNLRNSTDNVAFAR
ncbi:hypothetical protein PG988_001952 [Apiospora saccharicola]